jgi:hypothetical protein
VYEKLSRELQARRRKLPASGAPQSEIDGLFQEEEAWSTKLLGGMKFSVKIGAPSGMVTAACDPAASIRPFRMISVACSIGARPVPSMSRAPVSTIVRVVAPV